MNLLSLNPWWLGKDEISNDLKLKELDSRRYTYIPPILHEEFKPGNIYSLRGPRQMGKTTAVKLIIKKLLLEHAKPPFSLFYWSCEDIADYQKLVELIQHYISIKNEKGVAESYIFLDEIFFVDDWQRGIKMLVDRGYLEGCCLVITGSNMLDIKTSAERLPGRKGKHTKDFLLIPLAFSEFCHLVGFRQDISTMNSMKIHQHKLQQLFQKYLITGGFPLAINEAYGSNALPSWVSEMYYSWIVGDLLRSGKSEKLAVQIISSLIRKQPSLLSWDSLAKDAEIKSHLTVSSYLEALESMFVLKINYFYNLEKNIPDYSKNKKLHFLDPLIYHVLCTATKQEKKLEVMYEDIVCFHLSRQLHEVFYTARKKEIDFIVPGRHTVGVEVKCQNKISHEDFFSLLPLKKGILVTKNHFEILQKHNRKYIALPIHCFLYLGVEKALELV